MAYENIDIWDRNIMKIEQLVRKIVNEEKDKLKNEVARSLVRHFKAGGKQTIDYKIGSYIGNIVADKLYQYKKNCESRIYYLEEKVKSYEKVFELLDKNGGK